MLEALARLGTSLIVNLHIHYDRQVLAEPVAAALDSPVQWLFDRTAASGATEGQLVAVSLSARDRRDREIGHGARDRFLPELERVLPAATGAGVIDFAATHEPRATFLVAPRTRRLRPGPVSRTRGVFLAGAWTDRAGRRRWKAPSAAASPRPAPQ